MKSLVCIIIFSFLFLPAKIHAEGLAESTFNIEAGTYKPSSERIARSLNKADFSSDAWLWSMDKRDSLHKNGRRDSVLIVPKKSSSKDMYLIIWFHGLGGFTEKGFNQRIIPQMNRLYKSGVSFGLALPEMPWSTNTSTKRGRQSMVWREKGSLESYVKQVRVRLIQRAVAEGESELGSLKIVIVGHSAGGSALMSASREGGLCRINPHAVIFSDASYGSWLDRAWGGCVKSLPEDTELHVITRKWDSPHKNAERAMRRIKRAKKGPKVFYQVMNRKRWTHRKIGNNALSLSGVFPPGC